jgi:methylenetetrahydrofolate reductase (NADPH)
MTTVGAAAIPLARRRLAPVERLNRSGRIVAVSFEFFPPKTAEMRARLDDTIDRLGSLDPAFVSVTYGAGGTTRGETYETVLGLAQRGFKVAAHLTCVAHPVGELRELAARYLDHGITHLLALRGDLPAGMEAPSNGLHASDLVALLRDAGVPEVSVAAFPEGHPETNFDLRAEIENLKRKEAAGATRAITQFSLDNQLILRFIDRARRAGVTLDIVPGILPVVNVEQARRFASQVGATIPSWLDQVFAGLDDEPQTRQLVAAIVAAEQCADLSTHGIEHVHLYTLNRPELSSAICRVLGRRAPCQQAAAELP